MTAFSTQCDQYHDTCRVKVQTKELAYSQVYSLLTWHFRITLKDYKTKAF